MKTIKSFIIVALAVLTCGAFTSCKDDANDWEVQTEGLRQWSPTNLTATAGDTYITLGKFYITGATGYVAQIASDENFTQDVISYDIPAITSEGTYDITGLTPETTYYLRIKAVSTGKDDSTWLVYTHVSDDVQQNYVTTKKAGESADEEE